MFLEALGEAWGTSSYEPYGSVGAVISRTRGWLDGDCHAQDLRSAITALLDPLRGRVAAEDVPEHIDPELKQLRETLIAGFEATEDALLELDQAIVEQEAQAVKAALKVLEETAVEVRDAESELDAWVRAPVARCPKCGTTGPEVCELCQAERLLPDPDFTPISIPESLGPDYVAVLESYLEVLSGEGRLDKLWHRLDGLEGTLEQMQTLADRARKNAPGYASQVQRAVNSSHSGLERMRAVAESRQTADLNQGWAEVLQGALDLQKIYQRKRSQTSAGDDQVQIGEDD